MKRYSSNPRIQHIHEMLDKIQWILDNKKPYPENYDPNDPENIINDFLRGLG